MPTTVLTPAIAKTPKSVVFNKTTTIIVVKKPEAITTNELTFNLLTTVKIL